MSQKKHKKRKPQGGKPGQNPMELQQTSKRKKYKPVVWNMLWLDLIFLAVCQILLSKGMIGEVQANIATLVGLVLLVVALVIQFRPEHKGPKTPRL